MAMTIRAARPDDGAELQAIELAAGERFREVGLGFVADHDPGSIDELAAYADDGRSWVAVDDAGIPVGYVLAEVVDGNGHVEQVSVLPDRQGTGIGRALIDQVRDWADAGGMTALTLTTFTDVAWNRPLYEHLGFRVLADDEIGPELRALMAARPPTASTPAGPGRRHASSHLPAPPVERRRSQRAFCWLSRASDFSTRRCRVSAVLAPVTCSTW